MSNLLAARSQMAVSLAFHIIFAEVGIAMPLMMTIAEWRWLRTRDHVYLDLARQVGKGTAIASRLRGGASAAALGAMAALWLRKYRAARVMAIVEVSLIVWGWALGQFPYLVPPNMTVETAAAPTATLRLLLIALITGLVLLIPSLRYLFRVFKSGTA